MPTCADIFNAMPGRFNGDAAGPWETVIQFNVAGEGGGNWTMEVKGGKCTVAEGTATGPKATVNTDADTWVGINTGKVNPMQAFMTGKIKVQGNMGELMKLQNPSIFKKV
ncbi:MAG TPA: SCP2 sterol-binding domain-containing protein [Planctomycetota bacterium]|nr:SCP2 sterol-binding domain-containing protein [Planctomycetota bacterium]